MPTALSPTDSAPKYVRLAERLRREILERQWLPGDRLPSLTELRAQYGASQATAERAQAILANEGLIVREPNRGVFVAERANRRAVGVIGIVMLAEMRRHPYFAQLFLGVEEELQGAGQELLVLREDSAIHWEKVDGVLVCSPYVDDSARRLPPRMPYVSLLYCQEGWAGVKADDRGGIAAAVDYLAAQGHRNIALLGADDVLSKERLAGYKMALRKAGIEPQDRWIRTLATPDHPTLKSYFPDAGRKSIVEWLTDDWTETGCTAVLAQNDETAIGVIEAFDQAGLHVPSQVSVVGFDGTEISTYARPRLTTVEIPLYEIGRAATKKLLAEIGRTVTSPDKPDTAIVVLPAQLVVRDSTAAAP